VAAAVDAIVIAAILMVRKVDMTISNEQRPVDSMK
jgi:hypothetical protein